VTEKQKRWLKWLVKLTLTSIALYFVFTKIDAAAMWEAMSGINIYWLLLALLLFNLSKIISAFRLNHFYKTLGLQLTDNYNLKLYYLGMFYNLFLPGSIGGDGYKVYLLKQHYPNLRTRELISGTLLDRLAGLALLFLLAFLLTAFSSFSKLHPLVEWLAWAGALLAIPAWWLLLRLFFRRFLPVFGHSVHLSLWVQVSQLLSSLCLLNALQVEGYYLAYLTLFLVSSAVSILPLTVGGVGLREMVFLYGLQALPIAQAPAIAFSLLFFGVTACSSFLGIFFSYQVEKPPENAAAKDLQKEA